MSGEKITIYTDGAAKGNPGNAGWGAILMTGSKVFELGGRVDHATNNQMELTAPIEALKYLKTKASFTARQDLAEVEIVSDSKYVILGITEWIFNWQKNNWRNAANKPVMNRELWEELYDLVQLFKPKWEYVKGHNEHEHNDRADLIATSFAEDDPVELKEINHMQNRVFYSICFGFLVGVLLRSFVFVDLCLIFLGLVLAAGLLFYFSLLKWRWGIISTIFILSICLGIFRFNMADVPPPNIFESKVDQKVSLSGEIIDEPNIKENDQQLTVEVEQNKEKTEILVSTSLDEEYKYGDEINFTGKLAKPENFTTDQGKVFDYINYLRKDSILYVMSYPKIDVVSRGNGNFLKSFLFFAKEKFLSKMNSLISAPENLLMGGLILGEKSEFDQALRQSFVNTGTIHIVALSGYNVTIVAEWLMGLLALITFLPKNFGIGVGIFAVLLFIIMTGGSSTAIRAGIMATLALVARATGRNYDVGRALVLAAVGMTILNPFVLVFDVSFQLSFLVTIAVIFLAPPIEKYFMWVTKSFELRDIFSITAAAYIFVFPFILYQMGNFSIVALPANVLILPFIPFTMMLGFITGFVGLVSYILAVPLGFISYLFLHYELVVIGFFSSLPFAAFNFPDFPLWLTILIYAYFVYWLFGKNIKSFFLE